MQTERAGRRRAIAVLVSVVVMALGLGAGLMYAIMTTWFDGGSGHSTNSTASPSGPGTSASAGAGGRSQTEQQDALAAAPMLQLPASAAKPQTLTSETAGPPIALPAAGRKIVPGGPPVLSAYPHTPEGALAALAALDEVALSTTDLAKVHEVYAWAAAPGAVQESQWLPYYAVNRLRTNLGASVADRTQISWQAVQGQIKGTVGADFVVACVLGEFDGTTESTSTRAGLGDCQRMSWVDGRWRIGTGAQPATAPSAWPGSADAVRAGWREIQRAGS